MQALEFRFRGHAAGYFKEPAFPAKNGQYRYMPYRSVAHYQMGREMKAKGSAEIEFGSEGCLFHARARWIEYGTLELSGLNGT